MSQAFMIEFNGNPVIEPKWLSRIQIGSRMKASPKT